MSSSQKQLTEF